MIAPLTLGDLHAAQERIRPHTHRTPVVTSSRLDRETGARLFFKCENLQNAGAFKSRGACNAVFSLSADAAARGVATHSSGNHAAALARAAALRGIAAYIVMPSNSPLPKQEAVRGYGGQVTLCEPTLAAREETCSAFVARTGATLIHPYNDHRIIAGQATAALELIAENPDLDMIVAPVGGGGLLSGTALAVHLSAHRAAVIGAEPAQADDARASFLEGRIVHRNANTIADGLRTSLGDLTFPIIRQHVSDILTTTEDAIVAAMLSFWQTAKLVVEPSGIVPFAVIREHAATFRGRRVGVILSGGNLDLHTLPWVRK
jgi:threonine dehydratase